MQEIFFFAPYVLAIAVVEVVLSFDNALLSAALADEFSGKERKRLLRAGMVLGFFFRILALILMVAILKNPWLKAVCGLYLLGISAKHIALVANGKEEKGLLRDSYKVALFQIAIADRVFGIQNIFTLSTFHVPVPVIFCGVTIGLLGFFSATSFFAKVISRYKGLQMATFSLSFIIGFIMISESLFSDTFPNIAKLGVIIGTYLFTIFLEHNKASMRLFLKTVKPLRKFLGYGVIFVYKVYLFSFPYIPKLRKRF